MDLASFSDKGSTASSAGSTIPPAPQVVRLRIGAWMRTLSAAALVLLALHLVVVWSFLGEWRLPLRDKFYFDAENNIPTVFSGLLLLMCAAILAWIATVVRARTLPFPRHWAALAVIFGLLAIDEMASIHELLINPMREAMELPALLRFPWVVAGIVFVAIVGLAYLKFLARLPATTRWLFLVSAALYVGGAVGMEMVGGWAFQTFQETRAAGDKTMVPYMIAMTLEETFEIAGALLFAYACMRHLRSMAPQLRIGLD